MARRRDQGGYVTSEWSTFVYPRIWRPDKRRPILYFTGGNGDDLDFLRTPASGSQLPRAIAAEGWPVISGQMGAPPMQWGNATAQARIGQLWDYFKAVLGVVEDRFIGIGVSKGAMALLNYARANPTHLRALIGIVPAANINDLYVNQAGLFQAQIDAAYPAGTYPPNGWPSVKGAYDPALNVAAHASLGIPSLFFYGSADAVVLPAIIEAFMAGVGSSITPREIIGTDHLTTGPAIDPLEVLDFLVAHA